MKWRRDASWLLDARPPYGPRPLKERALWWAVIKQAAHDLRYSHQQNAIDALDFLRSTGEWLSLSLYGIPQKEYREEVTALVVRSRALKNIRVPLTFLLSEYRAIQYRYS